MRFQRPQPRDAGTWTAESRGCPGRSLSSASGEAGRLAGASGRPRMKIAGATICGRRIRVDEMDHARGRPKLCALLQPHAVAAARMPIADMRGDRPACVGDATQLAAALAALSSACTAARNQKNSGLIEREYFDLFRRTPGVASFFPTRHIASDGLPSMGVPSPGPRNHRTPRGLERARATVSETPGTRRLRRFS